MYQIKDISYKIGKLKRRLRFSYECFFKGDDEWFVSQVKKIGKEKNIVGISRGKKGEERILYHIFVPASYAGFFANYGKVLAYLYFADQYNLTPVIEFSKQNMYAESHPVNGSENPFEYYFRQPCGISLKEMKSYGTILESRRENSWLANELDDRSINYVRSDQFIQEMGRIVQKYIRLNPSVEEQIFADKKELLNGKKTLGVHVRGTDFKQNYNGHPVCVKVQEYLEQAIELVEHNKYEQIFLATDDYSAVRLFTDTFGDRLKVYSDVIRSDGNITVMKSESERENHHYLLGMEVLRDMMTLADCDGLLAGLSQVSYAVRFQKISYGKQFEDLKILNKGINEHTNRNCPK